MADAGFGIDNARAALSARLIPLLKERYFFLFPANQEISPTTAQVLTIMRNNAFRKAIDKLPGDDAENCGRVLDAREAFKS